MLNVVVSEDGFRALFHTRTVNEPRPLEPVGPPLQRWTSDAFFIFSKIKAFLSVNWDIFICKDINVMHTHHLFLLTKSYLKQTRAKL